MYTLFVLMHFEREALIVVVIRLCSGAYRSFVKSALGDECKRLISRLLLCVFKWEFEVSVVTDSRVILQVLSNV